MSLRSFLLQVLSIALGVLGGVLLSQSLLERRVERMLDEKLAAQLVQLRELSARPVVVSPPSIAVPDPSGELRLIREQLTALAEREVPASPSSSEPGNAAEAAPAPSTPSPAQEEASERAQEILDNAISRGRWTEEDDLRFNREIHATTPARLKELSISLSKAINSGQLRPAF